MIRAWLIAPRRASDSVEEVQTCHSQAEQRLDSVTLTASPLRDGSVTEMKRSWERYMSYLRNNERRFPPGAYSLATSDWYFGATNHRAPHDAWLEEVVIGEPSSGERHEVRETSIRVRLLGAYHDKVLEFVYPKVIAYTFTVPTAQYGHYDWRYDEFRLSEAGNLVHEIEWAGPPGYAARWIIEASDVLFTSHDRSAT